MCSRSAAERIFVRCLRTSSMTSTPVREKSKLQKRADIAFLLLSLAIVAVAVWRLVPRWLIWYGGEPNSYSSFLSAASVLMLALMLPLQIFSQRARSKSRNHRVALHCFWLILLAAFLVTFALELTAAH